VKKTVPCSKTAHAMCGGGCDPVSGLAVVKTVAMTSAGVGTATPYLDRG
jgi:hypothetical protein